MFLLFYSCFLGCYRTVKKDEVIVCDIEARRYRDVIGLKETNMDT
jgi:hypothetical protein